ncbi:MAG: phage/plasmid primase, P4 family [Halobacteriota archaeon]|nr:phage/plasmid primase, P4 family [Halobacteriota archaeon]
MSNNNSDSKNYKSLGSINRETETEVKLPSDLWTSKYDTVKALEDVLKQYIEHQPNDTFRPEAFLEDCNFIHKADRVTSKLLRSFCRAIYRRPLFKSGDHVTHTCEVCKHFIEFDKPKYCVWSTVKEDYKSAFNACRLADEILDECPIITVKDTEKILRYCDGYYHIDGETFCKELINAKLGEDYTIHKRKEIIDQIRCKTYIDREELNIKADKYLNLANGVLNLEDGNLMGHNPDFYFTTISPIKYNPDADCPTWISFLEGALEREDRKTLQKLFGECLTMRFGLQMYLLHGASGTGKSTALEILERIVGLKNICHESLYALCGGSDWAIARLFGKKVNISAELNPKLIDIELLKQLIEHDYLVGNIKYQQNPIEFQNTAKMVFAMNELPKLPENISIARRILMIPFIRVIPEEDRIEDYAQKELAPEISGILNWAIEGLRLLDSEGYPMLSDEEKLEQFSMVSNPVETFADRYLEKGWNEKDVEEGRCMAADMLENTEVYEEYRRFCRKILHIEPCSKTRLTRELRKVMNIGETRVKREGNDTKRFYVGIKRKGEESDNRSHLP